MFICDIQKNIQHNILDQKNDMYLPIQIEKKATISDFGNG